MCKPFQPPTTADKHSKPRQQGPTLGAVTLKRFGHPKDFVLPRWWRPPTGGCTSCGGAAGGAGHLPARLRFPALGWICDHATDETRITRCSQTRCPRHFRLSPQATDGQWFGDMEVWRLIPTAEVQRSSTEATLLINQKRRSGYCRGLGQITEQCATFHAPLRPGSRNSKGRLSAPDQAGYGPRSAPRQMPQRRASHSNR